MSSKQKALIALQAARRTGASMTAALVIEEKKVYDELNPEQYAKYVREKQKKQDFIADDGGDDLGYADDGEEHWDEQDDAIDDIDEEMDADGTTTSSSGKRQKVPRIAPVEKRTAASLLASRTASSIQAPTATSELININLIFCIHLFFY
jgi:hypothetical protein